MVLLHAENRAPLTTLGKGVCPAVHSRCLAVLRLWPAPCRANPAAAPPPAPPPIRSLRAALNSTQGAGEPFYLGLGLTPGSAPDAGGAAAVGGRRKRGSSALRRDSESQGALSEK